MLFTKLNLKRMTNRRVKLFFEKNAEELTGLYDAVLISDVMHTALRKAQVISNEDTEIFSTPFKVLPIDKLDLAHEVLRDFQIPHLCIT